MNRETIAMSELNDKIHEEILAQGQPPFPWESYRRLLSSGTSPELALQLLGWQGPVPDPNPAPGG